MDKLDFTRLKENTTHGNFILPFSIGNFKRKTVYF